MNIHVTNGPYDQCWQRLYENGYHPLPIMPETKKPGVLVNGEWREMVAWQDANRRVIETPQPGAGLSARLGLQRGGAYLVALDWDHDDLAVAAMYEFPSAVQKEGRRGFTSFFVARREISSKDFRVDGKCVVQVLSTGRQTVLPPTVHPDTRKPYIWSGERSLFDTNIENLPELPPSSGASTT